MTDGTEHIRLSYGHVVQYTVSQINPDYPPFGHTGRLLEAEARYVDDEFCFYIEGYPKGLFSVPHDITYGQARWLDLVLFAAYPPINEGFEL